LGPFSNGRSCTLGGGRAILTNAPDGATLGTTAPKPLEIDPVSGKTWNLYKYNFVQNMVSECDRCNDNRGIDLDCHWGGANNGDRMGYAMTYVFADQARTTDLRFGGNSYKLWINGDVIIDKSDVCAQENTCYHPEDTVKPVSFQKGRNTVIIQTGQAGVKHPSLSFLIKIDNTNGLRVSAHPGFDRAVPVIATVSHRVSGQTTWLQSQATCAANKMTLCKRVDICPSGKLKQPIGGKRDQEAWVATSGGMNEWTSIGDFEASKNLCRTHEDSMGTRPLWSAVPTEHNFRTEVICCGVKNAVLDAIASDITIESFAMPKSTTWKQANEICTSAGQLLCSKYEICPDGPNTQPISGKVQNQGEAPTQEKSQRDSDVWVPTRGVANEWTSVGNYDPSNRLCRTHTDSLGANPTWSASTGNHNFRQEVLCCSPGTPLVRTNTDVPKAKPDVVQVWDACASLDEERAECAAFFLEVSTSPIPANEGYCDSKVLEEVSELTNQETCGDK
jgi:hypothetical protein